MEKKKVVFFEKTEHSDKNAAQKALENETFLFKFKLICGVLALLPTLMFLIFKAGLSIEVVNDVCCFIGYAAAVISCPIVILKTAWNFVKFGWYIIPFAFIDLVGAVFGLAAAFLIFAYAPAVYCAIGLYQCYLNKKSAEEYLTLVNAASGNHI